MTTIEPFLRIGGALCRTYVVGEIGPADAAQGVQQVAAQLVDHGALDSAALVG